MKSLRNEKRNYSQFSVVPVVPHPLGPHKLIGAGTSNIQVNGHQTIYWELKPGSHNDMSSVFVRCGRLNKNARVLKDESPKIATVESSCICCTKIFGVAV